MVDGGRIVRRIHICLATFGAISLSVQTINNDSVSNNCLYKICGMCRSKDTSKHIRLTYELLASTSNRNENANGNIQTNDVVS